MSHARFLDSHARRRPVVGALADVFVSFYTAVGAYYIGYYWTFSRRWWSLLTARQSEADIRPTTLPFQRVNITREEEMDRGNGPNEAKEGVATLMPHNGAPFD